jgi:hypothetical protein
MVLVLRLGVMGALPVAVLLMVLALRLGVMGALPVAVLPMVLALRLGVMGALMPVAALPIVRALRLELFMGELEPFEVRLLPAPFGVLGLFIPSGAEERRLFFGGWGVLGAADGSASKRPAICTDLREWFEGVLGEAGAE